MKNLINYIQEGLKVNSKSKFGKYRDRENWSIKNAEDGDVVSMYGSTLFFIYKCLNGEHPINNTSADTIVYHAYYLVSRKKLEVGIDTGVGGINGNNDNFKLATDEEQEEFYKALRVCGYEWDNNKKEIVEI